MGGTSSQDRSGRMRSALTRGARGSRGVWRERGARVRGNQSGLTFIEVLVSVVVLTIVVAPMFDAFVRGRVLVAHRAEERVALRLVERKVEQLLLAGGACADSVANITSRSMSLGTHPTDPAIVLMTKGDNDPSNDVNGDLTWNVTSVTWSDPSGSWNDATYKNVVVQLAWPQGAHRDSVSIVAVVE